MLPLKRGAGAGDPRYRLLIFMRKRSLCGTEKRKSGTSARGSCPSIRPLPGAFVAAWIKVPTQASLTQANVVEVQAANAAMPGRTFASSSGWLRCTEGDLG